MRARLALRTAATILAAAFSVFASCTPDKQGTDESLIKPGGGSGGGSGGGGEDASAGGSSGGGGDDGGVPIALPDVVEPDGGSACADCPDAAVVCGDGVQSAGERCDDGNLDPGDGCGAGCDVLEEGYACPTPGERCVSTVRCGDAKIGGAETCDDGNSGVGDGCGADCQVEPGWACAAPGQRCQAAACGDGIRAGREQCDDARPGGGDGCDDDCREEPGFVCELAGAACRPTTCGDGVREGSEQCDDAGRRPYDGCSPACKLEPRCQGGACTAVCGDGLVFPQEACDDGNQRAGDGCSPTCEKEEGFACQNQGLAPPDVLQIPILYRDFNRRGTAGNGHPDFEWNTGAATGLVQAALDAEGKPVFARGANVITDATSFHWWYHDTQGATPNPFAAPVFLDAGGAPTTLSLARQPDGAYRFSSNSFFPVDGLGHGQSNLGHNFHFTSELRYQFTYRGGERLDFTGDDDVWVFINGQLAVDLGGVHGASSGGVTLDAAVATTLGLTAGGMYEIALFQAERHTSESNYRLTLTGFDRAVTTCVSVCGDGVVAGDEVCDDGVNDGSYGGCAADCLSRGPSCGDGTIQSPQEACDDGVNLSPYGGCAPGCQQGGRCGDGKVDGRFGEQCDDGVNDGAYGGCDSDCTLAPRCGDGVTQPTQGEACDDGNTSNRDECSTTCETRVPA